jgi:Bacterial Ig-like domain (group 3)
MAMRINLSWTLILVSVGLFATGCGDFWQPPGSTGSGTTATSTTLAASTTTPTVGVAVTLTATVSPSAATGTVTFYDGATTMGTGTLSSGTATLSASFTTTGSQSLTATYGGSGTYASSTSSAISVTVSAASSASAQRPTLASTAPATAAPGAGTGYTTSNDQAAAIRTGGTLDLTGGTYTAQNAEAAVVEGGGTLTLTGTTLNGAAGDDRGVLLYSSSPDPAPAATGFVMTDGAITYTCDALSTPACADGATSQGQNNPATLFSVANTTASIALTDVEVADNTPTSASREGTLLTAAALNSGTWGTAGANGGNVTLTAKGTTLAGSVIVDRTSTATLAFLADSAGTGSSLTGAINTANTAKTVSLALDQASSWTVTGTSYLTTLTGLDLAGDTVNNIDGGGHCVYYSGMINGSRPAATYSLSGGGYLAPVGTSGLPCQ